MERKKKKIGLISFVLFFFGNIQSFIKRWLSDLKRIGMKDIFQQGLHGEIIADQLHSSQALLLDDSGPRAWLLDGEGFGAERARGGGRTKIVLGDRMDARTELLGVKVERRGGRM